MAVVLFREDLDTENELAVCKSIMATYAYRTDIPSGSLVVGRYSVLPFYKELDRELTSKGSRLINSYSEHCWISDLQNWYPYFEDITPKTWFSLEEFVVAKPSGSFVLKGQTNSKKFNWDTHMYAESYDKVSQVYSRLLTDSLVGSQNIYIRAFHKLEKFGKAIGGIPITNEHRVFFLDGQPIASGYYWNSHLELKPASIELPPEEFLLDCGSRLKARFVVIDVARQEDGSWIVVELNDGQMSGLETINPHDLYSEIQRRI